MTSPFVPVRSPFWWVRWVPAAVLLAALVSFAVVAGSSVLVPLLLSFALVFMLEPLVEWFQRRKLSRNVSVLLALVTSVVVVIGALLALVPSALHDVHELVERVPTAIREGGARVQSVVEYAKTHLRPEVLERVQTAIDGVRDDPSQITDAVGGWLMTGAFGLVNLGSAAIGLLIVPFFVYYLLLDLPNIRDGLDRRIPERFRPAGAKLFDEIGEVVRGYVRGRFLVAVGMSIIYALGLYILRVPLALGIGIVAGLIGIIPYLGVTTGAVLALAFALLDGAGPGRLVGVIVVFVIAQLAEDYVLTPRLIGDRLDLHPMLVFIALIIAGDLFGLIGLVLAIPVLAVCKVLVRFFDQLYQRSEFFLGRPIHALAPPGLVVRDAAKATASHALQDAEIARAEVVRETPEPERPRAKGKGRR